MHYLKVIDLTDSRYFSTFRYFSVVPNLEKLILSGCIQLSEIHSDIDEQHSVTLLKNLIVLNLRNCENLEKLPPSIEGLSSLMILDLSGCSKLHELPEDIGDLKCLTELDLRKSGIRCLPPSMSRGKSIQVRNTEHVANTDFAMGSDLRGFTTLNLSNCKISDGNFPDYFDRLVSLEDLILSRNPFTVLPTSISRLSKLKKLDLEYCRRLKSLGPELPSSLESVDVSYCFSLNSFLDPQKPCNLRCSAICVGCFELVKRQDSIITASTLLGRYLLVASFLISHLSMHLYIRSLL